MRHPLWHDRGRSICSDEGVSSEGGEYNGSQSNPAQSQAGPWHLELDSEAKLESVSTLYSALDVMPMLNTQ